MRWKKPSTLSSVIVGFLALIDGRPRTSRTSARMAVPHVKGKVAGLEELDEKPGRWTSRSRRRLEKDHAIENDSLAAWLTHGLAFC